MAMGAGMSYNKVFPGHQIAMAPPLTEGRVTYGDGTEATVGQQSRDVVQFLAWAAEPHQAARKQMGVKVVLYLLAFAAVMYGVKRKVWSGLH
jgi:ubiquinol-cytochrome c reductase cytochrome c1 subunit